MTREQVDTFEKLIGQIHSTYAEVAILSKRAPNDALNEFKLAFINRLIVDANALLGAKYLPFDDFGQFESEAVPQNSDVAFILAQYIECFETFRADHVVRKDGSWHWMVKAGPKEKADASGHIYINTAKPKRLRD
jgi:hypothetical protein